MKDLKKTLAQKQDYDFNDLCDIMKLLRSPDGCPWDAEQDHKSIRKNFIEEVYEVCEAIDEENSEHLCEELGDVMLQVVFHSEMERAKGSFDIGDVINGICRKLVHRHPHVFGDVKVDSADGVLVNWDEIKKAEKGQKSVGDVLESVPKTLPALMRAQKIVKKAEKNSLVLFPDCADLDALDADGYAEMLMRLCKSANKKGIDLEEILDQKCTQMV
ncbi:MAG: MazG family protein, partial [Clostridia bacterium]|nr:MazG family protein [Clostridia bacterium]